MTDANMKLACRQAVKSKDKRVYLQTAHAKAGHDNLKSVYADCAPFLETSRFSLATSFQVPNHAAQVAANTMESVKLPVHLSTHPIVEGNQDCYIGGEATGTVCGELSA